MSSQTDSKLLSKLPYVLMGSIIGITCVISLYILFSLELLANYIVALTAFTFILALGVLISYFLLRSQQEKITHKLSGAKNSFQNTNQLIANLLFHQKPYDEQQRKDISEQLVGLNQTAIDVAKYLMSLFANARMFAWLVSVVAACGSAALFSATYMQVQRLDKQITLLEEQNKIVNIQNVLLEAERRSSLNIELTSILEAIDTFISNTDAGKQKENAPLRLPKLLNGRIVALSRSLIPYRNLQEDGGEQVLSSEELSPERGHLLLALVSAGVDMNPILELGADFSSANFRTISLKNIVLKNAILNGIDFGNLRADEAIFSGASLIYANLNGAFFLKVTLDKANMHGVQMVQAELRNVTMIEGNLSDALLEHTNFVNADLRKTSFNGADVSEARFSGANLQETDFQDARAVGALFRKAHLPTPDKFEGATLSLADFYGARIPSADWLDIMRKDKSIKWEDSAKWSVQSVGEDDHFLTSEVDENG